jgi:hypothetical protein
MKDSLERLIEKIDKRLEQVMDGVPSENANAVLNTLYVFKGWVESEIADIEKKGGGK